MVYNISAETELVYPQAASLVVLDRCRSFDLGAAETKMYQMEQRALCCYNTIIGMYL